MRAKNVMSNEVISVNAGETVLEAVRLLVNAQVSAMPVIDDHGIMVGILSEADVIQHTGGVAPTELSDMTQALSAMDKARSRRVDDVMTKDVVTATEDTTLHDIAELMMKHQVKRVPILRDQSVVGMVSRVDLLRALISVGLEAYAESRQKHRPRTSRCAWPS
jgi:CBS domain-containing protein